MTVMLITKVTYNYGNIPTFKTNEILCNLLLPMMIVLDNPILKCLIFPPQNTRTQSRKLLNIYYYYHHLRPESFHKHSSAHFTVVKLQQKDVFKTSTKCQIVSYIHAAMLHRNKLLKYDCKCKITYRYECSLNTH